jgi:hypothetical protein
MVTPSARHRDYLLLYAAASAGVLLLLVPFLINTPLRLNSPGSDIWQHLAAINAIAENPADPSNPFVRSDESSRLFGPLWVLFGSLAHLFHWSPVQTFQIAGVITVIIWLIAIFVFGTSYFGTPKGAVCLLLAVMIGWTIPPSFTGYYSPLTLIMAAGYPATMALALILLLWGLCVQHLNSQRRAISIPMIVAFATATHPLSLFVGLFGCGCFAVLWPGAPMRTRIELLCLLGAGLFLALFWPYFNPLAVLLSAGSSSWTVGVDFYSPYWIFASLFPAAIGFLGLKDRKARPLLLTLGACSAGFLLGATPLFAAGHRLLPFISLVGHIGLAKLLSDKWDTHKALISVAASAFAICQTLWTVPIVAGIQHSLRTEGSLLVSAQALSNTIPRDGLVAGHGTAPFPFAAIGRRVLSTPFAEPLILDMATRQDATSRLFDLHLPSRQRQEIAAKWSVAYLVADDRQASRAMLELLGREHTLHTRHGHLVMYAVKSGPSEQRPSKRRTVAPE